LLRLLTRKLSCREKLRHKWQINFHGLGVDNPII
jgi:hypothetical protein